VVGVPTEVAAGERAPIDKPADPPSTAVEAECDRVAERSKTRSRHHFARSRAKIQTAN